MKKISRNFRFPEDVVEILDKSGEENRTELVISAIKLISRIDMKTIENIAHKHRVLPDLLVDAAVLYFSKLSKKEQADKLIDYLDVMQKEAEKEERGGGNK